MKLQAQLPLILLSFHSSLQQSAQFSGLSAEDTPNQVSPLPLPRPFSTMHLKFTGLALCTLLESQVLKLTGFSRVIWCFTLLWKQYSPLVPHSTHTHTQHTHTHTHSALRAHCSPGSPSITAQPRGCPVPPQIPPPSSIRLYHTPILGPLPGMLVWFLFLSSLFFNLSFPFSLKKVEKKDPVTRTNLYLAVPLPSRLPTLPLLLAVSGCLFPLYVIGTRTMQDSNMIQVEQSPRAGVEDSNPSP